MKNCNILVLILFLMGNGLSISMPPLADRINTEHAHTPMQALDVDTIELMSQQEIDILSAELESQKHNDAQEQYRMAIAGSSLLDDALMGLVDSPSNYTKERRPAPAAFDYLKELCDELPIQSPVEAKSTQEQVAVAAAALSFAQAQEGVSKSKKDKEDKASEFVCERCAKIFKNKESLRCHKYSVHGNGIRSLQKKFECTIENCKSRFDSWFNVKKHALTHGLSLQDTDQEKWRNLAADFYKSQSFARSANPKKETSKSFACSHCLKKYMCKDSLLRHVKKVHEKESLGKKFQCIVNGCQTRHNSWYCMREHALEHDLFLKDDDQQGWLNFEMDSQKEQLLAGSAAPSSEEIAARNKRDAERDKAQRELQSTLPALAAAASSSQAANPSGQEEISVVNSEQKKFQCTVEDCKARFNVWGWMKRHALKQKHGLPIQDNDQGKWRNLEADFWKNKLLAAASGAPSQEEITARNKRDAERDKAQRELQSTLPALAAAALSSQAANPSGQEKISVVNSDYVCDLCGNVYPLKMNLERHIRRVHEKDSLQKKFQCTVEDCKARFNKWGWMKRHALEHDLPIQDNDQGKWRNLEADFWKNKLSAAASGAPSQEEITARNKRDAEFNTDQQNLQSVLPALAAAASLSQATAPSLEKEKVLSVGAKRAAVIYPEDQPPAKKQKSQKKNLAERYPKYIDPKYRDVALKTFPCSVKACKDMFRSQTALNVHVENSHTNKTKKFICPIPKCGARFDMEFRMNEHKQNHAKAKKTSMDQAQTK